MKYIRFVPLKRFPPYEWKFAHCKFQIFNLGVMMILSLYLFKPHNGEDEITELRDGLHSWRMFHSKIQLNSNFAFDGHSEFLRIKLEDQ